MPNASAILFDFRKRIAGDPDAKRQFHRRARRQLIELAEELNFGPADYDLRSNEGGIAVSGEVTLHAERLYVQVSQPATGNDTGVLFRDCQGRRDYTGGRNTFASLDLLHRPAALAALIRRHVTQTSPPHPQQRRLTTSNDKLAATELDHFTGRWCIAAAAARIDDECGSPFSDNNGLRSGDLDPRGRSDKMVYFAGLDVSVKATSVCVVDDTGKVILEQKAPTEPADIIAVLTSLGVPFGRIGIEAGPLSQWLVNMLMAADLPMICVETRHMKALLTAQQISKTDRNDARGIAQMMRVGLFKPVHVKTLVAQEQRMLLTSRKLLQRKLLDVEADLRGTLRNFGLKVGVVSSFRYERRVRELVAGFPRLAAIVEPLLSVRRVMRQQFAVLHKMLLDTVRCDPVCRRLMTAPGVGAVVALTYRATVDQPQRFVHSRAVGAHVGLTPKRYQSGETDYDGGVSKCGDPLLRTMLYEAAHTLLTRGAKWSWLKAWGVRVAQRRGMRRATVAVARRLAVVLHRMWVDGSEFRWGKDSTARPAVA